MTVPSLRFRQVQRPRAAPPARHRPHQNHPRPASRRAKMMIRLLMVSESRTAAQNRSRGAVSPHRQKLVRSRRSAAQKPLAATQALPSRIPLSQDQMASHRWTPQHQSGLLSQVQRSVNPRRRGINPGSRHAWSPTRRLHLRRLLAITQVLPPLVLATTRAPCCRCVAIRPRRWRLSPTTRLPGPRRAGRRLRSLPPLYSADLSCQISSIG